MSPVVAIARREFASYFATPLALVFLVIFLMLAGIFTFYLGGFFGGAGGVPEGSGQADLQQFFLFHPWLYLLLVPAIAMRLWAEERKSGTLELLLTQPVAIWQAVLGKFAATWAFLALALALTFPIWITVNWLGDPDNGVIVASYVGSWLMGGALLAIGGCLSAATRSQVIAFILAVVVMFFFVLAGFPLALDPVRALLPQGVVDAVSALSVLTHFRAITRGVLDLRDVVFFLLAIGAWLLATIAVIELKKAD
jgi:ABC-2 type transport system permease protein